MLPTIGLMIGCYILLRCLSFATRTGEHKENDFVRIAAVLVFLLTIVFMWILVSSSVDQSETLRDFM